MTTKYVFPVSGKAGIQKADIEVESNAFAVKLMTGKSGTANPDRCISTVLYNFCTYHVSSTLLVC